MKKIRRPHLLLAWPLFSLGLFACSGDEEVPPPAPPSIADGIFAELGEPVAFASAEQLDTFMRGREVLKRRFTPEEGLGPSFNVTFCGACHEKPVFGGSSGRYRNFLLVGNMNEAGVFTATGVNGIQQQYDPAGAVRVPDAPATNIAALRNAIPFFGVGLLAELPDDAILENADPDDADGDGISGRPNYDRGFVGRFGRKSQTVSIEGFIRGPLFNHLGITSAPLRDALRAQLPVPSNVGHTMRGLSPEIGATVRGQAAAPDVPTVDLDDAPDPELAEQDLFDLVSFSMLLAAPRPEAQTPATEAGRALFGDVGCDKCHVPALLGPRGLIPLYSDLLLHDMGAELADGIFMKEATGSEFRTQPLWGVAAVAPYLHDGRADTLDQAIRLHGGEATAARDRYLALSDSERASVVGFLESLGGRDQRTEGLLAPDEPIPSVGEYGGPWRSLDPAEKERFRKGREVFDRDFSLGGGLGPRYNGDSCRACHFDPVIGGAGPAGVNVTRQGIVDTSTTPFRYTQCSAGSIAHKLLVMPARAPVDPEANTFEHRQPPLVLGVGRIDQIPDAEILAREDPEDADGDGIRGVAQRTADGRLGRLGWKADVPSVHEFARDGMSNEVGVTVPAEPGQTFGKLSDQDGASDPEVSLEDLEALVFYMDLLAPPHRKPVDAALEAAGEALFGDVGCAGCHVPALTASDGTPVPLYSDLLLHDVAPAGYRGIAAGNASMRQFRTPPLWGLSETAPYLHDGRSYSIEDAIARHEGEAAASQAAYQALAPADRAALLAFLQSF